eukprot:Nk52_evm46s1073 gene=Nk52_evmTU46s1073
MANLIRNGQSSCDETHESESLKFEYEPHEYAAVKTSFCESDFSSDVEKVTQPLLLDQMRFNGRDSPSDENDFLLEDSSPAGKLAFSTSRLLSRESQHKECSGRKESGRKNLFLELQKRKMDREKTKAKLIFDIKRIYRKGYMLSEELKKQITGDTSISAEQDEDLEGYRGGSIRLQSLSKTEKSLLKKFKELKMKEYGDKDAHSSSGKKMSNREWRCMFQKANSQYIPFISNMSKTGHPTLKAKFMRAHLYFKNNTCQFEQRDRAHLFELAAGALVDEPPIDTDRPKDEPRGCGCPKEAMRKFIYALESLHAEWENEFIHEEELGVTYISNPKVKIREGKPKKQSFFFSEEDPMKLQKSKMYGRGEMRSQESIAFTEDGYECSGSEQDSSECDEIGSSDQMPKCENDAIHAVSK